MTKQLLSRNELAIRSLWGLPDFRSSTAYPLSWPDCRWQWEAYRRRELIRTAFATYALSSYQELTAEADYDGPAPDEPGFWAMPPGRPLFGMAGIPNPAISDQPFLEGLFEKSFGWTHVGQGNDYLSADQWTPMFVAERQFAFIFDLDKPQGQQFDAARAVFKNHGGSGTLSHRSKWPTYLRVLDAREVGARYQEIGKTVLGLKREGPQAVWETLQQAIRFRDHFSF